MNAYCELNRYQRQQYVRSIESSINDLIDSKLMEDTYTKDEVTEILTKVRSTVSDELEAELINILQTNLLMLYQLFQQAEKWHLQLTINVSEMQNKELLQEVRNVEHIAPAKLEKLRLSPLSTNVEKTSEVLRLEIATLKEENDQLLQDIKCLQDKIVDTKQEHENIALASEEKDELIKQLKEIIEQKDRSTSNTDAGSSPDQKNSDTEKILQDYESVLKEQIANELEEMKKKVDAAQSQLSLAEMELEKKFNNTVAYSNMKKIILKKNDQLKDLRSRLLKYETIENLENETDD